MCGGKVCAMTVRNLLGPLIPRPAWARASKTYTSPMDK
jgi:hypothetical protein